MCYRLYTEGAFGNEMLAASVPEIQRTNLAMVGFPALPSCCLMPQQVLYRLQSIQHLTFL